MNRNIVFGSVGCMENLEGGVYLAKELQNGDKSHKGTEE